MKSTFRGLAVTVALIAISFPGIWCQQAPVSEPQAATESIGDVVQAEDKAAASRSGESASATAHQANGTRPIHLLYMHGISQVGAGDSLLLRKAICKYLGECVVTSLGRVYADGPFAVDSAPPSLALMGERIWNSKEEWSASAPFIDRYEIKGNGHTPILLDEFNWWPLAYPLKCKWLIARDARLTGPSRPELTVCATPTAPDPAHPNRYLSYQWISTADVSQINHAKRHAKILNRSLKNGLMDWGFGDAVMALGPMEEVLSAGIRELLVKSLTAYEVETHTPESQDDAEVFFITHSLGSYLSLISLDADLLGPGDPDLLDFQITPAQRQAADYFSAHTAGFYFLANQIALLQLARVSAAPRIKSGDCSSTGGELPSSLAHWRCKRDTYLKGAASAARVPQIVAWSDPDDLLSWEVPQIEGIHVVNISVKNSGFNIPPFVESPTAVHANYAKNREVLRYILRPSPQH